MVAQVCPKCNSKDIEADGAQVVCTNCGQVLEECAIVSEVQFSENAGGQSSVVGQFVPENGVSSYRSGPGYGGFGKDSRELTLSNGKRIIQQTSQALHLAQDIIDQAYRRFQQAVSLNFIQGRKTHNVVAVCLYVACRYWKTRHMLIDFAENLHTDVYELGSVFLKFCKLVKINDLAPIDPSLFIDRFAASLEFGDKTNAVARTAMRVVANMNREWMITGRRPAGICGAGLLIAAKMHGFHRTEAQVAHVVRICDGTLKKRLNEFEETSASQMTVSQFNALFKGNQNVFVDANEWEKEKKEFGFTNARKPPALKQQEKKRKVKEAAAQRRAEEGQGEQGLEDGMGLEELGNQASKILQSSKALRDLDHHHEAGRLIAAAAKQKEVERQAAAKVAERTPQDASAADADAGGAGEKGAGADSSGSGSSSGGSSSRSKGKEAAASDGPEHQIGGVGVGPLAPTSGDKDAGRAGVPWVARPDVVGNVAMRARGVRGDGEWDEDDEDDEMLAEARRDEEEAAEGAAADQREENEHLSDVDDDEIEAYIRTQEEACERETTWNELNRDYIEKQAEKQRVEEMKEAAQPKEHQVKRKRRAVDNSVSRTAHEAASKMIRNRNLSNKVNYDALQDLFGS
jgi:transcription factor IIIB subunit 2